MRDAQRSDLSTGGLSLPESSAGQRRCASRAITGLNEPIRREGGATKRLFRGPRSWTGCNPEAIYRRGRLFGRPPPTTRRDVSLRIEIVGQDPASSPTPIAEAIDIPLLRDEELQEADALVHAR